MIFFVVFRTLEEGTRIAICFLMTALTLNLSSRSDGDAPVLSLSEREGQS